jgi:hypothetical protein
MFNLCGGVVPAAHNIPEGVAVALPVYFATRSRLTAFLVALASGLAEPAGERTDMIVCASDQERFMNGLGAMFRVPPALTHPFCPFTQVCWWCTFWGGTRCWWVAVLWRSFCHVWVGSCWRSPSLS